MDLQTLEEFSGAFVNPTNVPVKCVRGRGAFKTDLWHCQQRRDMMHGMTRYLLDIKQHWELWVQRDSVRSLHRLRLYDQGESRLGGGPTNG